VQGDRLGRDAGSGENRTRFLRSAGGSSRIAGALRDVDPDPAGGFAVPVTRKRENPRRAALR